MEEFEKLLEAERVSVERFVRFRLNSKADADDVLQEVFLAACQKFAQLKNKDFFKAWICLLYTSGQCDHRPQKGTGDRPERSGKKGAGAFGQSRLAR